MWDLIQLVVTTAPAVNKDKPLPYIVKLDRCWPRCEGKLTNVDQLGSLHTTPKILPGPLPSLSRKLFPSPNLFKSIQIWIQPRQIQICTNLSSSYSCPGETRPQKVHVAAILCQWILGFWGHLTDADYGGYLIASSVQLIPLNWAFDLLGGIGFYRFC